MLWSLTKGVDPFGQLRSLQRDMNRFFNFSGCDDTFPAVNIWGNENEIILTTEIPGADQESLNVTVVGDQLTIQGERKPDEIGGDATYFRRERETGKFIRSFKMPFEVNNDVTSAQYKNGILKITLPRLETSKPRKITIN